MHTVYAYCIFESTMSTLSTMQLYMTSMLHQAKCHVKPEPEDMSLQF